MLSAYPAHRPQDSSLKSAAWVDLLDPTEDERKAFEQAFGLRVPTSEELVEIEATSRLRNEHGALYMTAPLLYAADDEPWVLVPTGFVLSANVLLTVRSSKLVAFHNVIKELENLHHSSDPDVVHDLRVPMRDGVELALGIVVGSALCLGEILRQQPDRDAASSADRMAAAVLRMLGVPANEAEQIASAPLPEVTVQDESAKREEGRME